MSYCRFNASCKNPIARNRPTKIRKINTDVCSHCRKSAAHFSLAALAPVKYTDDAEIFPHSLQESMVINAKKPSTNPVVVPDPNSEIFTYPLDDSMAING